LQRVAIARALALDVDVYLFDEPTANVDAEHTRLVESVVMGLFHAGHTVVLATHDRAQAERFGVPLLALERGRIVAEDEDEDAD
ncbi:MAG: phosphate ABC transporter ATP-binding protein, partial [Candidatus Binatia bacterium]